MTGTLRCGLFLVVGDIPCFGAKACHRLLGDSRECALLFCKWPVLQIPVMLGGLEWSAGNFVQLAVPVLIHNWHGLGKRADSVLVVLASARDTL